MTETGFAEQFYASHRMGPACTDLFENLSVNNLKGGLSNATTFKPPLFSLVNTFKGYHEKRELETPTASPSRTILKMKSNRVEGLLFVSDIFSI
jgi:hypothetical protein